MSLADKLICNGSVILEENRYNDGTLENPDITIDKVWVEIKGSYDFVGQLNLDIAAYMSKEDDDEIWEVDELYRTPFIENFNILDSLLEEMKSQSHLSREERRKPY